jgi:hypothetical protein
MRPAQRQINAPIAAPAGAVDASGSPGGWEFLSAQKVARGGIFAGVSGVLEAKTAQLPDKLRLNHRGFRNV